MIIGERLRALREEKKFSQGDIEKKTGLLRCYVSRVENGHTVPSVETLEKFARALEVPMYQLFYDGEAPPKLPNLPKRKSADDVAWGSKDKHAHLLAMVVTWEKIAPVEKSHLFISFWFAPKAIALCRSLGEAFMAL